MSLDNKFWNVKFETMPRNEIKNLQLKKLKSIIKYAYDKTPFVKKSFKSAGITPDAIKSIEDYTKRVPTITKDQIRSEAGQSRDLFGGYLSVAFEKLLQFGVSRGVSGERTFLAETENDLDICSEMVARGWYGLGARKSDTFMVDQHVSASWSATARKALSRIGCLAARYSTVPPFWEVMFTTYVRLIEPNVINQPTWLLIPAIRKFIKEGINVDEINSNLKFLSHCGDLLSEPVRKRNEEFWGVPLYDTIHIPEVHVFGSECPEKNGIHFWEDLMLVELLDPESNEPVGQGEKGEVTFTVFDIEAQPYLRWRSGDMATMDSEPCACGRTHVRAKYYGRKSHTVKVNGGSIYLRDVEEALWKEPAIAFKPYQLVKFKVQPQPKLVVRASYEPEAKSPDELKKELEQKLGSELGVKTEIEMIPPEEVTKTPLELEYLLPKNERFPNQGHLFKRYIER